MAGVTFTQLTSIIADARNLKACCNDHNKQLIDHMLASLESAAIPELSKEIKKNLINGTIYILQCVFMDIVLDGTHRHTNDDMCRIIKDLQLRLQALDPVDP